MTANIVKKDFETTVWKILKELKECVEKVNKMLYEQKGNINKEIEALKTDQKEILELKCTLNEMKYSLEESKGKFEEAEERINKLKDRLMEIVESEE